MLFYYGLNFFRIQSEFFIKFVLFYIFEFR